MAYLLFLLAGVYAGMENVFIGSGENSGADVVNAGEVSEAWINANYTCSTIDSSSYVKFFIWSDVPGLELNIQVDPPLNMQMMPFIYR